MLNYSFEEDLQVKESAREVKARASQKRRARSYKISYYLNMLNSMSQEDGKLIDAIAKSKELSLFKTPLVKDLVDSRWQGFAAKWYQIGLVFHLVYVVTLSLYIRATYMGAKIKEIPSAGLLVAVGVCLIYPAIYDGTQFWKRGRAYFQDFWNFVDIFHICGGYFNIYLQTAIGPKHVTCKWLLVVLVLVMLFKLFFFLRIDERLSIITTMIMRCIYDLRVFLFFFVTLLAFFGMTLNVLGPAPAAEYRHLHPQAAHLLNCLRISVGDFNFEMLDQLTLGERVLFWCIWLVVFLFGCLIFLNFIIAEVSNSYQKVQDKIDRLVYRERAVMVKEVEDFLSEESKASNKKQFPKYLVVREPEEAVQ